MLDFYIPIIKNKEATSEDVAHILLAFVFAGHETAAHASTTFIYRSTLNPEVIDKLKAEINEQLLENGKYNFYNIMDVLTIEKLNSLEYVQCVAKECLRIDPPANVSL